MPRISCILSLLLATTACSDPTAAPTAPPEETPPLQTARTAGGDTLYDMLDLGLAAPGPRPQFPWRALGLHFNNNEVVAAGHSLMRDGTWTDIGSLGGGATSITGINDHDVVVGSSRTAAGRSHAFRWEAGTMTDLGTLGGPTSSATAIAEDGTIIGTAQLADSSSHAFRWEDGVMTDLGTLGGRNSTAIAINRRGEIAGASDIGPLPWNRHTFRWRHGSMEDLGPLRPGIVPDDNTPSDIADDGTIVGTGALPGLVGTVSAFLAPRNGALQELPRLPQDAAAEAFFVNSRRMVAGQAYNLTNADNPLPMAWVQGEARSLGFLATTDTGLCDFCAHTGDYVFSMNDAGEIVGAAVSGFSQLRGYVWKDDLMTRLPDLGGRFAGALAINDHGVIFGLSTDTRHDLRWVMWRPRSTLQDTGGPR